MATTATQIFHNNKSSNHELIRQEIQAVIANVVELRAIYAALTQGNIPAKLRLPTSGSTTTLSQTSQFSAKDYPVFTPSYEEEPLPGYRHFQLGNPTLHGNWDGYELEENTEEADLTDNQKETSSSLNGLSSGLFSRESYSCPAEDHKSVGTSSSCTNHISVLQAFPPDTSFIKSGGRTGMEDLKSITICNRCKPATIVVETDNATKNKKNLNMEVSWTDSHSQVQSKPKNRGPILSRLFPRLKKKHKDEKSLNRTESEEVSQILKELGIMSVESLKKELSEANENRDAALMEVAEIKSSLGELKQKLKYLETYCEELKKWLKLTVQGKETQVSKTLGNLHKREKSVGANRDNVMPVSHEVMVEGFLQMVSEARISVEQFCETLVKQTEETGDILMEKLNLLLQPYKLTPNTKNKETVLYYLEAVINQSLYQDFENCVFQKNGSPKVLDPQQDCRAQFSSFVGLRNLSWSEVLRKGTKCYSEDFSSFCDKKMSSIISILNWTRQWPEQLLQSFFVAAKCIWLLHLLAFSFNPPLRILRVEQNRIFDPNYMEDILAQGQRSQASKQVKIMVMPGFYIQDRVIRCKVLCRYKIVA